MTVFEWFGLTSQEGYNEGRDSFAELPVGSAEDQMSEFNRMLTEYYLVYCLSEMGETIADNLERLDWLIVTRMLTGFRKKWFDYV